MKKTFFALMMLCTTIVCVAKDYDKPDFAFPQKVMAEAEARYQDAVKTNNGEALVDALIRWGLAKSSISQDYLDTILARIDTVRAHETRADIRCLLNILGHTVAKDCWSQEKKYDLDYSEVDSLWQYPLSDYRHIIRTDKIDLLRVPTLADFLWTQDTNHKPLRTSDNELLPYLYQHRHASSGELLTLYRKYQHHAESGEILCETYTEDSLLSTYQDYVKRFPKSYWTNDIKNKIATIERKVINIRYPDMVHSGDSLEVYFSNVKNLTSATLKVFAVPDKLCSEDYTGWKYVERELAFVRSYKVSFPCDTFRLAPLPYGRYIVQVLYLDDNGKLQKSELQRQNLVTISDRKQMVITTAKETLSFWVDINDGHPIEQPAEGDRYASTYDVNRFFVPNDYAQKSAQIFTDLSIYRPGEKIQYTVVCYSNSIRERKLLTNTKIEVILNDAFGKMIEEQHLQTDDMGQCTGTFVLPQDRANGHFSIVVKESGNKALYVSLGSTSLSVSEYKLPRFFVQIACDKPRFNSNDTIHITGHVENYNGVMMSGYPVNISSGIDTTLTTDHKGDFALTYYPGESWGTQFVASVTDEAGETQSASCSCYRTWRTEVPIPIKPTLKLRDLGIDNSHRAQIEVSVPWEAHIYYIACSRDSIVSQGWIHYEKAGKYIHQHTLPEEMDEHLRIQYITMHRGEQISSEIVVRDSLRQHQIHMEIETFRDRLFPSSKEQWTFRLTDALGQPVQGRLMLEMYQQALEELSSNVWQWNVPYRSRSQYRLYAGSIGSAISYNAWTRRALAGLKYTNTCLYQYDQGWFLNNEDRIIVGYGTRPLRKRLLTKAPQTLECMEMMASSAPISGLAMNEDVQMDTQLSAEDFASVSLRQMQTKVALWQPMLTTDENGNISVTIDIPEDNTTWRMQALAFSQHLVTDTLSRQLIVQRPVMVQPALPRFLRQGDETELKAMVQNTQDHAVTADVLLELFDPRTDKVLANVTQRIDLAGKAQQAVSILCNKKLTSQPLPYIGFRIKAKAEGCSDGEQQMLPLLEAAQPVIETTPFYLEPGEKELTLNCQLSTVNSQLSTLELCNNPTWYAVMALPTVCSSTGNSSPALAHQLYGLALAEAIASAQVKGMDPALAGQIRSAIENWGKEKDSVLVSPLMKNADLKIGTLLASPWFNTAERQTARMQSLQMLFDAKHNADTKDEILKKLSSLQNKDGGLSWIDFPERQSSLYATGEVLELLGELHRLGISINWIGEEKALAYYDSIQIVLLEEYKKELGSRNKINYGLFADYLYIRSLHDAPLPKANQILLQEVIEATKKNWRDWSLPIRAYIALALNRNGETAIAKTIRASLMEHAYKDGARGIYWDNLPWMWCCRNKASINALILMALHEIEPGSPDEDGVRRWLLLNKQSNDWGDASMASQVIYALLSTGTDWLSGSELQYTRRELTAKELASRQIRIQSAPGNPIWGALYVQRMATMDSLEAYSIEDLKINKEIIGADSIGAKATIRITVDSRRDMEYVNIKDLRASCFEPADRFSGYKWRIGAYCETKDAETNLFIQHLPKGHHVYTYEVYVTQSGTFLSGAASIQCQYAPQLSAHSAGIQVVVK